jgi:hypothetical protein
LRPTSEMASMRSGGKSEVVAYSCWLIREHRHWPQVHGVPLQIPYVHLVAWVDKSNSPPVFSTLVLMWRLAEKKERCLTKRFRRPLRKQGRKTRRGQRN